jgi:DNA-binding transcriptional ArsR family regulator
MHKLKKPQRLAALPEVLAAFADPLRLKIVRMLGEEGEKSCGTFAFEVPKSSLSHHFKVLRESGIILTRREGKSKINSLNRAGFKLQYPGLLESVLRAKSN